jgi:hypothetical protein
MDLHYFGSGYAEGLEKASIRIPQPCEVKQCSDPMLKNLPKKLRLRTFLMRIRLLGTSD